MFGKIAEEDRPYYDDDVQIPNFGNSTSDYDEGDIFRLNYMLFCP